MGSGSRWLREGVPLRWIRPLHRCWKLLSWIWGALLLGIMVNVSSSWLLAKNLNLGGTPLGWGINHPWIILPPLFLLVLLTLLAGLALSQEHTVLPASSFSLTPRPNEGQTRPLETPFAPVEVFYSFAEADAPLLEQLEHHLSMLRHEGLITTWHKRQIIAGSDWWMELDRHLNTASLILLLISPDFLASDYQYGVELQRAMERHNKKEARVIPILLRPCDWKGAPFEKLQAIPRNGTPLTLWRNRDAGFAEVAKEIRMALQTLPSSPFNSRTPTRVRTQVLGFLPLVRMPIGRDRLLLLVKQQLKDPTVGSPIVVLHGQPGVGKTTIAAHLAFDHEILASFPGGVLWADLGKNPSINDTLTVWASQLKADLSKSITIPEKIGCIQEKLGQAPFLLILDDLWLDDIMVLNPLLRMAGPGCASLITTRWRKVADDIGILVGCQPVFVDELDEEAALTLLMETCQEKLNDRGVLAPIAQAAGGLPLTLEVMGAYINSQLPVALDPLQVRQNLQQIENHLHLPGNVGPRRLTPMEVIDLSINNLPDRKTKHAFFALGAFAPKPATFSKEAMLFVTRADPKILQTLYDSNLLHLSSTDRYMLHHLLTEAARAHLHTNDAAWLRHRNYYRKQIERTVQIGQKEIAALKDIDWRTLFSDLPQIRDIRLPRRPASTFSIFVNRYLGSISWLRWLNHLPIWLKDLLSRILMTGLSLLKRSAHIIGQRRIEAALANHQGWLYAEIGDRDRALTHYEYARKLWSTILDNDSGLAQVLNNLGKTYYMRAEYLRAIRAYHHALDIRRKQDDRVGQAHILTNIGATLDMIGRVDWAIKSFHTALSLYQELQDERGEAFTLHHLGVAYRGLGERERALSYLEQALTKHTSASNDAGRARTLMELGSVYLDVDSVAEQDQKQDSLETAMAYFQQALELQNNFSDFAWQGRTYSRIGQVYAKQGEIAKALEAYLQALSIHQNVNYHAGISTTLSLISNLYREAGKDLLAQNIANEAKSEHPHYAHIELLFKPKLKS